MKRTLGVLAILGTLSLMAPDLGPVLSAEAHSTTRAVSAAAYMEPDPQCTICIDGISPISSFEPDKCFVLLTWGSTCSDGDHCINCSSFEWLQGECGDDGHLFHPEDPDTDNYLSLSEAMEWMEQHGCRPSCNSEMLPTLDALRLLVNTNDTEGLADVITKSDGRLVFVPDRKAIQGFDCSNQVVLHLPVSAHMTEVLLSTAQR